ncbi:MFS transporter [Azospirillum canadense]|uniref:MFS transporter n=1 Tax=Azospirillum canadense TaxID=403962 RepID=UPI0022265ED0|nr:MFS transporter [Azospirillum canadense]MCW2239040.1 ACS family hexuronate transporter-like MFS transporter [Azospirillum canadense]
MKKIRGLRWQILALVMLGTIVNYIDRNTLGILAPTLKEQLHFTTEEYSFVVSAFQLCYSLMQPVAGYITDLIGLKLGYFMFAFLWGTAAALHALAGGWQSMAFFRGLLGVSEAAAMPSGVKTSTLWFPAKERSIATGWFNTGSSVGAMVAPPLVIWLSVSYSWQIAFVVTGLMGVAMSLIWVSLYRNPENHPRLTKDEHAYILDGQQQTQLAKPSVKKVLGKRRFWAIAAARFLTEPAWQTFSFWIPLYMVSTRGMDIKQFALFAWLPFLFGDLGCILSGYLSPFFAKRFKMTLVNSRIAGVGIGAVCMIGPALIGLSTSPITAIFLFSMGAFAHQMLSSLLYALVTDTFEKQEVATATGFGGMAGYLGGMIFSLIIGQLANTIGYEPLFACLSVFDLTAFAIIALMLGQRGAGKAATATPLNPAAAE